MGREDEHDVESETALLTVKGETSGDSRRASRLLRELHSQAMKALNRQSISENDCPPGATYPNLTVPIEQLQVGQEFVDESSLSESKRATLRGSLVAPDLVAPLTDEQAAKEFGDGTGLGLAGGGKVEGGKAAPAGAEKAAAGGGGKKLASQMMFFIASIVVQSVVSIVEQLAVIDPVTGRKRLGFIPMTPILCEYVFTVCACVVVSLSSGYDVASIFSLPRIMEYGIVCVCSSFADWTGLLVQVDIDATLWKVAKQGKLPLTAVAIWLILGKGQTYAQIGTLLACTYGVLAFSVRSFENVTMKNPGMFSLAIASMVIITFSGVYCEKLLKKTTQPFVVQFGCSRVASIVVGMVFISIDATRLGWWHLFPFGGWHRGCIFLVIATICRAWSAMLIMKRLDSVWKSLGNAMSLNFTYILSCAFLANAPPWDWGQFLVICFMALQIVAYAAAKRDEQRLLKLGLQLDAK